MNSLGGQSIAFFMFLHHTQKRKRNKRKTPKRFPIFGVTFFLFFIKKQKKITPNGFSYFVGFFLKIFFGHVAIFIYFFVYFLRTHKKEDLIWPPKLFSLEIFNTQVLVLTVKYLVRYWYCNNSWVFPHHWWTALLLVWNSVSCCPFDGSHPDMTCFALPGPFETTSCISRTIATSEKQRVKNNTSTKKCYISTK